VRIAEYKGKRNYFEADVFLDSVEIKGTDLPLQVALIHYAAPRVNDSARNDRGLRLSDLQMMAPRNVGVFLFAQKHLRVRQWDSTWVTIAPETLPQIRRQTQARAETQQPVSAKQVAKNFLLAIYYSQQATDLLSTTPPRGNLEDYPKLADLFADRQNAVEAATATDQDLLNDFYPGLGDKFKSQFLEALNLFVRGCEVSAKSESLAREEWSRSTLLYDEWTNWYGAHRKDIDDAIDSNSMRTPASPSSDANRP